MHYGANGREPLKGLTFERSIPSQEFAIKQTDALQSWAIGFYNAPGKQSSPLLWTSDITPQFYVGALTFGQAWANPNKPEWNDNLKFHPGTCVFKLLFTTASDDQVFTMAGSPAFPAVRSSPRIE